MSKCRECELRDAAPASCAIDLLLAQGERAADDAGDALGVWRE